MAGLIQLRVPHWEQIVEDALGPVSRDSTRSPIESPVSLASVSCYGSCDDSPGLSPPHPATLALGIIFISLFHFFFKSGFLSTFGIPCFFLTFVHDRCKEPYCNLVVDRHGARRVVAATASACRPRARGGMLGGSEFSSKLHTDEART